jgi:hypothetical protein
MVSPTDAIVKPNLRTVVASSRSGRAGATGARPPGAATLGLRQLELARRHGRHDECTEHVQLTHDGSPRTTADLKVRTTFTNQNS